MVVMFFPGKICRKRISSILTDMGYLGWICWKDGGCSNQRYFFNIWVKGFVYNKIMAQNAHEMFWIFLR